MIIVFPGRVKFGRLFIDNRERFDAYLVGLGEDMKVEVTVRKWRRHRSLEQNRYYWGVIIDMLGNHFGYEPDEMHEALKFEFLRKTDGPLETVRSTTSLTTKEFSDYCEDIKRWAAINYQVNIPDPGMVDDL